LRAIPRGLHKFQEDHSLRTAQIPG